MEEKKKVNAYQKLVEGIENIVNTGKYEEFLRSMKKFHNYSFRNRLLIFFQNPDATKVAGYCTWKELGRGVKSNPKKIFILKPIPYKVKKEQTKGGIKQEEKQEEEEKEMMAFGWTIVYDISDTYIKDENKEIPLFDNIKINSDSSANLYSTLVKISPVKVDVETTGNGADGYYSKRQQRIVLSPNQSPDDMTATLLHEMTHALYDDFDYAKERDMSEIFVESVAYITADYFGLDTSKCSFSYITTWSNGDTKKLLQLGTKIQKSSDEFINKIEKQINIENKEAA